MKNRSHFFSALLAIGTMWAAGAIAADGVPASCDTDVYDMMKVQAHVEGQRELESAERLILKSDSTLEYSCFEQLATTWGAKAGPFSDNGGGTPSGNLSNAVKDLVIDPIDPYLQNFGHLFLGGTFTTEGGTYVTGLEGGTGICNPHHWIWLLAKCTNVAWDPTKNDDPFHFFPLSKLVDHDVRDMPLACTGTLKTNRDTQLNTEHTLLESFPDSTKNPPFGVDNASKVTGKNSGDLYTKRLSECGTPVKTGVKVKPLSGGGAVVDDAVCIAPGCSYNGGGCN